MEKILIIRILDYPIMLLREYEKDFLSMQPTKRKDIKDIAYAIAVKKF